VTSVGSDNTRAGPRKVLVIDDQRTFADLLGDALNRQPGIDRVVVAYNLAYGISLVDQLDPDVVVLDVVFDGEVRDGVDAAYEIRLGHPQARIVLLTASSNAALIGRATVAGVNALLAKSGALEELLRAVRSDGTGLIVDALFLESMNAPPAPDPSAPELTRRESDVLALLALGMDARAISTQLDISLNTCRSYIKTLLGKLHAHSQLEAVAIARRLGLLARLGEEHDAKATSSTHNGAPPDGHRRPGAQHAARVDRGGAGGAVPASRHLK
jgi:DNA-binding NarL/FixJ family response regulator